VREKEFQVHYQPQYSLHSLKLVGAEALVRWPRSDRMVSPGEFIPLAEKFGLISAIGEFVFETAARQLQAWAHCKIELPRVAVNTSSTQLLAGNFGDVVERILQENQLTASRIDIEVTESVMMKNIERNGNNENANCLSTLQEKGLEISIDDFGTGYSSLSYIKHLNVDRIKIDKSFIDDIEFNKEARSIVRAIIKMGHSLGMKVLAEGIETPNQLDILKALECDEGQGYLFSKPLDAAKFEMKCLSA
jgi:EAL domain-containing protein (putative c-di-GMP-specific phosphodiesterase class I)